MSLKVFDLQCNLGHVFEGWFGSAENYEAQQARGLLSCPVCNSHEVSKMLSAPRLNVSHIRNSDSGPVPASRSGSHANEAVAAPGAGQMAALQAAVMQQIRHMVRNTDNVGARFAEEARRMHRGEIDERAIRGVATPQEREELADDGIAIMPIPDFLDDERLQ